MGAGIELAPRIVLGGRHIAARIQRELFAVRRHFEHIVDMAVYATAVYPVCAFGDLLRKIDDGIGRFQIDDLPLRLGDVQLDHVCGLYVCESTVEFEKLWQVGKLCKARPCPVPLPAR